MNTKTAAPCYHPRSCNPCRSTGAPCGLHTTADRAHADCTGVEQAVENITVAELLRAAYALTHRMHAHQTQARASRAAGYSNIAAEQEDAATELRAQRDLIDAEIERRCAR